MRTPLSIATLAGLLAVCVLSCNRDAGNHLPDPPIGVAVQSFITFSPFYIGEAEGFFSDEGLDVTLHLIPSGEHGLAQLVSGGVDVFSGFPGPGLLNLIARGAEIRAVADRGYMPADACSYYGLMVRSDIEPGSLEGLIGRPIRLDPALPSFWLDKLLSKEGYSLDHLDAVDFPAAGIPDAFDSGAIDMAMIGDPWKYVLEESGAAYEWAGVKDWAPDTQFSLVYYGSRLLGDVNLGRRFMVAYLRAVQQYNLGPTDRNLDILVAGLGQPRGVLEATCWLPIRPDGRTPLSFLDEFQDWALKRGLIDRRVVLEQIWDPRFVDFAAPRIAAGLPDPATREP